MHVFQIFAPRQSAIVSLLTACWLAAGSAWAQTDASGANIARLELRISELERQIRTMTGQIERLSFDLRQANDRLDRALTDVEFRLTTLEGGEPAAGGAGAEGAAAPLTTTNQAEIVPDGAQVAAGGAAGTGLGGSEPGDPQVLGTITRSGSAEGPIVVQEGAEAPQQAALATPASPEAQVATQYNAAFALLQNRDYTAAGTAFTQFVDDFPDHALASNARYWIGESYYAQGQFKEAASAFALGYQQYPEGAKALDSLVKLGMTFAAMGQRQDACATLGQIGREFPAAPQGVRRRVAQELDRLQCG